MASTFTVNTGIEKIGSGEQAGSWGDTTNINFDIIDRVLNGVFTITVSGTVNLTTTESFLQNVLAQKTFPKRHGQKKNIQNFHLKLMMMLILVMIIYLKWIYINLLKKKLKN